MSKANQNEFGKDLGLVHQAVMAGRKIGADVDFWTYLAQDQNIFSQVVKIVKDARASWLILNEAELQSIREWLKKLTKSDCPYPEDETYYTRSSHCEYSEHFYDLHNKMFSELYRKASQSKQISDVCKSIETCFVISYLLSGFYSAEQDVDGTKRKWMHGPFSITGYFGDILNDDPRVPTGSLSSNDFRKLEGLKEVYDLNAKDHEWVKANVSQIVSRLREIKTKQIELLEKRLTNLS